MRRIMIMLAALLSALAFSAAPAGAGVNELQMWSGLTGTGDSHVIAQPNIPTSCTAVDIDFIPSGQVRSAENRTTSTSGVVVKFYANLSNCTNDLPLANGVLQPNSLVVNDLDGSSSQDIPATYFRAFPL